MTSSEEKYHFNVPGPVIWIIHIIIGLFLIYIGYNSLKKNQLPDYIHISIIVLGVLAILYHAHIWIIGDKDDESKN